MTRHVSQYSSLYTLNTLEYKPSDHIHLLFLKQREQFHLKHMFPHMLTIALNHRDKRKMANKLFISFILDLNILFETVIGNRRMSCKRPTIVFCAYLLNHFSWCEGVSAAACLKQTEIEAKS